MVLHTADPIVQASYSSSLLVIINHGLSPVVRQFLFLLILCSRIVPSLLVSVVELSFSLHIFVILVARCGTLARCGSGWW